MNNQLILDELDYYVVGHQEAKKALIALLTRSKLRHYQKYMKEMDEEFLISPMKVLLIGSSGSGKTHLLESLQKIVHFPLVRVDATQMNPAGAGGGIKPNDLRKMVIDEAKEACEMFPGKYFSVGGAIDKTVVFIDEVDKLGTSFESSGNWNKHVQSNFLTMFDNKTDYAGLSFIFAGAFNEITKIKEVSNSIGFNPSKHVADKACLDDALVTNGLIPEIVGRLTHIVELDRFDKDMYLYILKKKLLPKKIMDLAAYGVFEVADDVLEAIADRASKSNQGVRYLHRALDMHFLEEEFKAGISYSIYNDYY
jgi:ATP-dependent Clp protease ATP-binding subunit ClpX